MSITLFFKRLVLLCCLGTVLSPVLANDKNDPIKIGFMLPYTGTYAALGEAITNGFMLHIDELGNELASRKIEFVKIDDESSPTKAISNANRLIKRDKVDLIVGTVHSGVALGLSRAAQKHNTPLIIPNAGSNDLTDSLCARNVFRTSFSAWQLSHAAGQLLAKQPNTKRVVTVTWKYSFGIESIEAFENSFQQAGGEVIEKFFLPFPNVEFQPFLTKISALKPDAVYVFFAGSGAVQFMKDYAASGLKSSIPLYSTGFLTEGVLDAAGESAEGISTVLHYAPDLENDANTRFRAAYEKKYGVPADVYAVQGYDSAKAYAQAVKRINGDIANKNKLYDALEKQTIDSPRGAFTFSAAHNPIQDLYLRQVKNGQDHWVSTPVKQLDSPSSKCTLKKK